MEKFIPQSPDKFLKKDADMSLAKFGHLNAIVDQVTANETAITALENETQYTEVPISSAEILTLGSAGVTSSILVPDGQYAVPISAVFEFTPGSTPYNIGTLTTLTIVFSEGCGLSTDTAFLTDSDQNANAFIPDTSFSAPAYPSDGTIPLFYMNVSGGGLGENPTLGDGTGLLKIRYELRTFGSEL